jgi:hypothetical protein
MEKWKLDQDYILFCHSPILDLDFFVTTWIRILNFKSRSSSSSNFLSQSGAGSEIILSQLGSRSDTFCHDPDPEMKFLSHFGSGSDTFRHTLDPDLNIFVTIQIRK